MIEVEGPGGVIVEFPVGTSREVMQSAMRQRFAAPSAAPAAAPAADGAVMLPEMVVTADGGADLPLPPPAPPQPLGRGQSLLHGVADPIQGGAQLLTNALPESVVNGVNDATAWVNRQPVIGPLTRALGMVPATREDINRQSVAREDEYQARRGAGGESGLDLGRLGGSLAASLPAGIALPAGGSLLGALGAGAVTGAAMEGLQPVTDPNANYWDEKTQQTAAGFQLGAAGGLAGNLIGRAIAPNLRPEVRELQRAGVSLTPGQMTGGLLQRAEDAITSYPFIGGAVSNARREGVESFNRAAGNRVLEPIGDTLPAGMSAGREMVAHLQQRVTRAYDEAIAQARPFAPDPQFAQDIQAVGGQFLTPQTRQTFINYLQDRIVSRFQGGPLDGRTYQTIKSDLGQQATRHLASQNPADQELGQAFLATQRALQDLLGRANPQVAPQLRAVDTAFATLQRLNAASSGVGAVDGVFTPAQLNSAVRSGDRSLRHQSFARGDALLQDLSGAGRSVLPSSIPDSGTAGRLAAMGVAAGGLAGIINAPLAAGVAGTSAVYSAPMRRAMAAFLAAQRPESVSLAARLIRPSGGAVSAPLAAALLSRDDPPTVAPLRP
ncbi:hypothetical protein [Roseococcus pinisoli]|uniref:Uncharacterized protein n=1 Tax=Roseococcus pinisoli TaxID=2835040 RepID=A0ABS5QCI1_9PROT|nr:hypothetical protein [Roseococcus pinisoli]MBS7811213.1 hypothetical protein [Roseococcus pinisoli]